VTTAQEGGMMEEEKGRRDNKAEESGIAMLD